MIATTLFPSRALVRRELLTLLRTRRAAVILILFAGIAFLYAWGAWPEGRWRPGVAEPLFAVLSILYLVGAYLFIPGLAAVSLTVEHERDTYDILSLTLIRPAGILAAKLINILGFYYLLLFAILPIFGSLFFLTGLDVQQVLYTLAVISTAAFACACAGLLCSAFFRRSIASVTFGYFAALCLTGLPSFLIPTLLSLLRIRVIPFSVVHTFVTASSPLAILSPDTTAGAPLWVCPVVQLLVGIFCLLLTYRLIRRPRKQKIIKNTAVVDDIEILNQRRKRFPYYLIDPLKRKKPIEDRRNAMLVKELRWGLTGKATNVLRTFYISLVVLVIFSGAITLMGSYRAGSVGERIAIFPLAQIILFVVIAPVRLANILTKEYEFGNMDLLRTTLLTPRQIVMGKVGAALLSLAPLLASSLIACTWMALYLSLAGQFRELAVIFTGYGTLGACVVLSVGIGVFSSLVTRRTGASIILSYVLSLAAYIGFALLMAFITEILIPSSFWRQMSGSRGSREVFWLFFSPIGAFVRNISRPGIPRGSSVINTYWLSNVVLTCNLGWGLINYCCWAFGRYRMRDK